MQGNVNVDELLLIDVQLAEWQVGDEIIRKDADQLPPICALLLFFLVTFFVRVGFLITSVYVLLLLSLPVVVLSK